MLNLSVEQRYTVSSNFPPGSQSSGSAAALEQGCYIILLNDTS